MTGLNVRNLGKARFFKDTPSKSKARFNIKPKSTIQHRKGAEMTYIWSWVYWLEEHASKSGQYRFTKFGRLTGRDPNEGAKII